MILALTANGPGEFAGWVRPLLRALYRLAAATRRARLLRSRRLRDRARSAVRARAFPRASVYAPGEYLRFALGRPLAGLPARADRVLYLGGDLMHAARVHDRLGGIAGAYKFSHRTYAERFVRVFAVDEANARSCAWGVPHERIERSSETSRSTARWAKAGASAAPPADAARDGVIFFPGSRKHEIEQLVPFSCARGASCGERPAADRVRALAFTPRAELRAALAAGGIRACAATRARTEAGRDCLATQAGDGASRSCGPRMRGRAARAWRCDSGNEGDRARRPGRSGDRDHAVQRAGTR